MLESKIYIPITYRALPMYLPRLVNEVCERPQGKSLFRLLYQEISRRCTKGKADETSSRKESRSWFECASLPPNSSD